MPSIKVKLNTNHSKDDGTHQIIIQVIHNRVRRMIGLKYYIRLSNWDDKKKLVKSSYPNSKRLNNVILLKKNEIESTILDFEAKGKRYDVDDIISKIKGVSGSEYFFGYSEEQIKRLKDSGRKGNSKVYQYTLNSFKKFRNERDILLSSIDYKIITRYEAFLRKNGCSANTVSFYMRTLRAIINNAIKESLLDANDYAFKNYKIKSEPTQKRAISKETINKIVNFDLSDKPDLVMPHDLFLFSFYMRGMSFVDVAYLKVSNIHGDRLTYSRKKTGQKFSIKLTDKSKDIIRRYNNLKDKESYIFPILHRKGQEYLDYRNAMRLMNKKLKAIAEKAELDEPLTTYTARHSWATIAKRMGVATAIISEGLGHDSEETTQIYLDSFENDVLDDANELITG